MVRITCGNPFSHAHNSTSNHLSQLRRVQGHPEKTGGGRVWAQQFGVLPANQARRTTCVHYQLGAGNAKKKYAGRRVFTENMSAAVFPAGTIYLPQAQGALYLV